MEASDGRRWVREAANEEAEVAARGRLPSTTGGGSGGAERLSRATGTLARGCGPSERRRMARRSGSRGLEASRSAKRTLDSRVATPRCGRDGARPASDRGSALRGRGGLSAAHQAGTIRPDLKRLRRRPGGGQAARAEPVDPMARNSSSRARLTSRMAARSLAARAVRSSSSNVMPGLRNRSAPSMDLSRS